MKVVMMRVLPLSLLLVVVCPQIESSSFPVFPNLDAPGTPLEERRAADFRQENNTEMRAEVGTTAVLHCPVLNLGPQDTVSWVRRRDYHLLTVGYLIYSRDARFQLRYIKAHQDWQLHIRFVQPRDEGVYECQVTTHPPVSLFSTLRVLDATAEIQGGGEKYVRVGSSLKLVCLMKDITQPPVYVFWYHKKLMINYRATRQVQVVTTGGVSVLLLNNVRPDDTGNYTCSPSNTKPAHIMVHVLRGGETPAAIHSGGCRSSGLVSLPLALSLFLCLISTYVRRPVRITTITKNRLRAPHNLPVATTSISQSLPKPCPTEDHIHHHHQEAQQSSREVPRWLRDQTASVRLQKGRMDGLVGHGWQLLSFGGSDRQRRIGQDKWSVVGES